MLRLCVLSAVFVDRPQACRVSPSGPALIQVNALKSTSELQKPTVVGQDSLPGYLGPEDLNVSSDGLVAAMPCWSTLKLNASFNMDARCPADCPYHALDRHDQDFCTSACVSASQCAAYNPDAPVADPILGSCRSALVDGCVRPSLDGSDSCEECGGYYYRTSDGKCKAKCMWAAYVGLALLVLVAILLVAYAVDLNMRPATNEAGLREALQHRSGRKYRTLSGERQLWPLSTNLCRTCVGGPGLLLHFNFQAATLFWAAAVGLGWVVLAYALDTDLLVLGRRAYGSAFKNCVLVAWGHDTQQRLMWTKLFYVSLVYVASFLGCLFHGVRQRRLFQQIDAHNDTMKAFAAICSGLPPLRGSESAEEALQRCVAEVTGQPVVGVSVCWDFGAHQERTTRLLHQALGAAETNGALAPEAARERVKGRLRRAFFRLEQLLLLPQGAEGGEEEITDGEARELLRDISSSSHAYVVFETRAARDEALTLLPEGFQFRGHQVSLSAARQEPHGVYWQNFDSTGLASKLWKLGKGFLCIMLGLTTWGGLFYMPYAWSILTFNYEGGRQPGLIYSLCFSMVVVIGNVSMVEICTRVSDNMGFKYKDSRETCYMILYLVAVSLNVVLDLVMTYYMAYQIMSHLGFRTYDGVPLPEVQYFMDRFEAYAMQRAMGQNLYEYAFPSTFLVPFLFEPALTIYGLLRVCLLIVRSHPEMSSLTAKGWLSALDLELGRYADCLLNVFLAVIMFFFPGGYTHWIFFMLAISQAYIYIYDHWRVLRVVPAASFTSMDVDWWSQVMLAPCCGLLASCLVFKGNCQSWGYCLEAPHLLAACVAACLLHCLLHLLLLLVLVPALAPAEAAAAAAVRKGGAKRYKDVAAVDPCSWFSANPVHCLRSKYFYAHSPPCSSHLPGYEHMMQKNESIGCFFQEGHVQVEDASDFELQLPKLRVWLPAALRTEVQNSADGEPTPKSPEIKSRD